MYDEFHRHISIEAIAEVRIAVSFMLIYIYIYIYICIWQMRNDPDTGMSDELRK